MAGKQFVGFVIKKDGRFLSRNFNWDEKSGPEDAFVHSSKVVNNYLLLMIESGASTIYPAMYKEGEGNTIFSGPLQL